ncbi:helix-turn-helix domain-containing protein [Alcaligenaceae bacterium A4P071]|uniref:TetR/AcrR family transcriptional regulator n=1 Tax=Xanthomonas sp. CFBP 8151 TaxID=3035310 RepID=UPI00141AE71B|nr:TetR/AcrR family transcriptional regulator [Xanthomonas sp. CFBP 8151]MDQ2140777.1 helix-turn-helix domain-containing protein [Alcaligenaceae bacterium B3P038]MDQ2148694.1 helix-turn-helix domain-containing protein [Alcaligenaceae bacterium C4P045]MDQ2188201.1 helix-turn-helix domain-containing protein [Alcaligenaceae bacterium A4P071]NIJ75005.1 AcrR family transcriptional regulator [Xanthomonas sp. CFBP 8151]
MRATLMRAGLEVMAEKGIAATSVDDVVRHAEVARGSFYKYFDGTAELAEAIGTVIAEEVILGLEEEMTTIVDPAERLATGITGVLAMVTANPVLGRFLVRGGWPVDRTGGLLLDKIGGTVAQGIDQGRFFPVPMPVAMALVGGVVLGCAHEISATAEPKGIIVAAAGTVLRGLGLGPTDAEAIAKMSRKELKWKEGDFMQCLARQNR